MPHTYASVAQFNDHLRDTGSTTFANEDAKIVARKLAVLEAVSRHIDGFCHRSRFGSGFGPRLGTNRYNGDDTSRLELDDDLLSVTTLTIRPYLGGTGITYVEETDWIGEPYDATPKRRLIAHGYGSLSTFTSGERTIDIAGKWGERDQRRTATATVSAIASTTTTSVTVSADTEFSPGQTLLIDAEQLYVTAVNTATEVLTVKRGQNGTTAATHAGGAVDIYEYHPSVVDAEVRLALLRYRGRDAAPDGTDASSDVPVIRMPSEQTILWNTVGDLRLTRVR